MKAEQLSEFYPRLFHMAWQGSWPNICRDGLLSTQALVKKHCVSQKLTQQLLKRHRPHWVDIASEPGSVATVRDQKPMSDEGVRRALSTNNPSEWYELLNSMVFLWPTKARLRTMMNAKAYEGMSHDLLIVDTAKLLKRHKNRIRLSPMNSGATKPFPHPRGLDLFQSLEDYPFDDRLKRHRVEKAIAEVCVVGGIKDIRDLVIEVRTVNIDDIESI